MKTTKERIEAHKHFSCHTEQNSLECQLSLCPRPARQPTARRCRGEEKRRLTLPTRNTNWCYCKYRALVSETRTTTSTRFSQYGVLLTREPVSLGTLRFNDATATRNNRFNKLNNNFARASRFFVHFFAVFARLRRENV